MNNQQNDNTPSFDNYKKSSSKNNNVSQQELDAIEYVFPVKKEKNKTKKHSSKNKTPDNKPSADAADDFVFAQPHSKKTKKHRKLKRFLIIFFATILGLIIVAAGTLFVLNQIGKSAMHDYDDLSIEPPVEQLNDVDSVEDSGKTIKYNGGTYVFNEDVATVVFLGIDTKDFERTDIQIGTAGQADAIYIAVIDTKTEEVTILGVSRDTMVDVNVYNTKGEFVNTQNLQICLSFAYGDGAHTSCENTLVSLQRLFYGMKFDTYFAFDTRALETLTDTIGGVTITALTDFYSDYYGRTIKKGETVTLYGNDATMYARSRDLDELDSNNDRMARQQQYMTAFLKETWSSIKSEPTIVLDLYDEISDNSTTNLDISKMTYLVTTAITGLDSYNEVQFVNLAGTVEKGEYAEFHVDQKQLMETMLDLFYVKVK